MKKKWSTQIAAGFVAAAMTFSLLPADVLYARDEAGEAGTPYTAQGDYNVGIPHVIVNQIYGGSSDGAASHSFVELYNQSAQDVDLTGWRLAYRSSRDGDDSGEWQYFELAGTIRANGYYLVRCGAAPESDLDFQVPEGDQQWDIQLHNKGVSVALLEDGASDLADTFQGEVTDENRPEGYVDLLAVQGNDGEDGQVPPVYEGAYAPEQSKKKAVRRQNFADTDNNAEDIEVVDYSKTVDPEKQPHTSSADPEVPGGEENPGGGSEDPGQTETYRGTSFEDAALNLERTGDVSLGAANADGGVAEIAAYNPDNRTAYIVNGQDGLLYAVPVNDDGSFGSPAKFQVKDLIDGFTYGDMTSVAVDTAADHIVIALQAENYADPGRIAVLDYEGNLIQSYETGVQPDMVTVSKDGKWILTADEGEPREGYAEGITDPQGSVTVVNTQTGETKVADFSGFDSSELAKQGILFAKVDGEILGAQNDLEPEYIALDPDGTKAYVTLQEANAVGILDLASASFTDIKGLGFQDFSREDQAVDFVEDGTYQPSTYKDVLGVRMPDGISAFQVNGKTYIATANEGDARDWPGFSNEAKAELTDTNGQTAGKVRVLDPELTAGLDTGKTYVFGGRSFTIYDADTMDVVYDSGNEFESRTAAYLPQWFNCSNDDIDIDSRSAKKGVEPESVTVGQVGDKLYAFIGLERIGGVMVYDVTDPANASYVNYINTRDFSSEIGGDDSPEGLAFISSNYTGSGKPMLLAACEVSGTVAAYTMTGSATDVPTPEEPEGSGELKVLYTNDVHCAIDGYSALAAYKAQLEEEGYEVVTVDAGDAIQGEAIGTLTEKKGSAVVDLMNTAGYDYAVPGNHEFDYGMDRFLEIAQSGEAQYKYLSANFVDLRTGETVLQPYDIVDAGGEQVAFVGITTPETYTKSTPVYFQDENGNYIYSFSENDLYDVVQNAVDSARAEGADKVIAVGHLGIEGTTEGWKSTDVIANTTGIDAFIDAHSHETIPENTYANEDGQQIPLTSTGTKFENIGVLTLGEDGNISTELISPDQVDTDSSPAAAAAYEQVQAKIDSYNAMVEEQLGAVVGTSDVELTINDPQTGERRIRSGETNMGDFVADAYRAVTGADIALVNGGGIRDSIAAGDVTKKDLQDVNPWSNEMCVIQATGQQILDALEHGAQNTPEEFGGFLQVSGLTYKVQTWKESSVMTDDQGMFLGVSGDRRVTDVMVDGQPLDPEQVYSVAGSCYTLQQSGDGFTMFRDAEVEKQSMADSDMLIEYFTNILGGKVTRTQYGNPFGDGRIQILTEEQAAPGDDNSGQENPGQTGNQGTGSQQGTGGGSGQQSMAAEQAGSVRTGDDSNILPLAACMALAAGGSAGVLILRRKQNKA